MTRFLKLLLKIQGRSCLLFDDGMQQQSSQSASDERTDYGHNRIAPTRRALVRDWQYRVCKPRPKVLSGVDRITSRSTK